MLKFLLSNIDLYDKTLSYNVTNPYTAFVELGNNSEHESKSNEWCNKAGLTQTIATLIDSATEFQDDYAFQELVTDHNLNGSLLNA